MEELTTTTSTNTNYNQIVNELSVIDYIIFAGMLLISAVIGIYFGFFGPKQNDKDVYLLGGKNMNVLAVSISLIASSVSGVALLALPADVYTYGSNTWWLTVAICISCFFIGVTFLPIFFNLSITSVYEYFNLRFDNKVRKLASFLFTLSMLLYNPIVIYIPALVFAQVTGFNVYFIAIITSGLCIIYTTIGGIKAVIWTDVFQFFGIIISAVAVLFLGVNVTGGFQNVWKTAVEGDRISLDLSWDPFIRDNIWNILIGAGIQYITQLGVNPGHMQKFFSVSTLKQAKQAVIIYCMGYFVILSLSVFTGNVMYTRYKDCDPVKAKLIDKIDQIVPYFVMDVAGNVPCIPGLFLAGIFSASLSTLSATINTISATIFEDFVSPHISVKKIERNTGTILKAIVVLAGLISTALVYVVANMGGIFPLFVVFQSITNGPLVGLFIVGVFIPFVNATGALFGGISGLLFIIWITIGQLWYKSENIIQNVKKPVSLEGCKIYLNETVSVVVQENDCFIMYKFSSWYNAIFSVFVVISVAVMVSCVTKKKKTLIKPELVSNIVRSFVPRD